MEKLGFNSTFINCIKSLYQSDCISATIHGLQTNVVYLKRGLRQGCSLSPLLFAIYIADMGEDIAMSTFGINIGGLVLSGLLLADDLVLISHTAPGLKSLLSLVQRHCDVLRMKISEPKSQVISPSDEEWNIVNDNGETTLTLKAVLQYKYLGITTYGTMFKTGQEKQKMAITTAHRYKGACIKMTRMGPDTVALASSCWSQMAIPSILHGTDSVPFSESTISEIERTQSQLAKFLLGLSITSPNVCAQETLGWPLFRHRLYLHQLKFYLRQLHLPGSRWSFLALSEHLGATYVSPYLTYIGKIRQEVGLLEMPASVELLEFKLSIHFLDRTNCAISLMNLPSLRPITKYEMRKFVSEEEESQVLSRVRYFSANLGNKAPRPGFDRRVYCPLCPVMTVLSELHLFKCPILASVRDTTGITSFFNQCRLQGHSFESTFYIFVSGLGVDYKKIKVGDYKCRGESIAAVISVFFNKYK